VPIDVYDASTGVQQLCDTCHDMREPIASVLALTAAALAEPGLLYLSANTVRTHAQNLMAKLGVHSTLEAVALLRRAQFAIPLGEAAHRGDEPEFLSKGGAPH
jgi:Bacterial regulatory proteins, luxR family